MNKTEYELVCNMTYLEYCDYLQKKYGLSQYDYMTKNWNKVAKASRTSEGLVAHHKFEDHAIMLSTKEFAIKNPFEWQKAKNIIYCDYLEHLLLHVLICEYPATDKNELEAVGVGGVENFLVPELNDYYSGWRSNQPWRQIAHEKIANDKDVYIMILKRYKDRFTDRNLCRSFNENFGLWTNEKNKKLYKEIKSL